MRRHGTADGHAFARPARSRPTEADAKPQSGKKSSGGATESKDWRPKSDCPRLPTFIERHDDAPILIIICLQMKSPSAAPSCRAAPSFGGAFSARASHKALQDGIRVCVLQRPVLGKRCAVVASITVRNHTLFSMLSDSREHAANRHSGCPLVDAFGRKQNVARRLNLEQRALRDHFCDFGRERISGL